MPLSGIVIIIGILLGITTLIGILGNISVCLVVFWNRSMRNQLHLFLVNLAIADVGMSASCMPFAVATVLFHEQIDSMLPCVCSVIDHRRRQNVTIGKAFCYFNGFINTLFAMASVLTICSLCVYQYVSVVLPMNKSLTNFRCLVMVLCAWVISIFVATGPAIHWGRYEFTSNIFNCEYYHTTNRAEISYNVTMMFCGYLFPCIFMIFTYVSILRALHKHQARMAVTSSISPAPVAGAPVTLETKLRMTMSVVVLTFLVCRTPFFVFLLLTTKDLEHSPDFLGQLSFWAIYLHSACDPFIYAFKHTEYQDTLKDIIRTFRLAIVATFCCCVTKGTSEEETKEKR